MTSKVTYNGALRTSCVHIRSNNSIITDAPVDNNGKGEAFSPTDLVATALASCMLTIMGIKADSKGIVLDGTRAEIVKTMSAAPRKISAIKVDIHFSKFDCSDEDKKMLEKAALACPVAKSLHSDLAQEVTFHW